jgi:hypothetical protein
MITQRKNVAGSTVIIAAELQKSVFIAAENIV